MIHARLFNPEVHPAYVKEQFDLSVAEGGAPEWDRPLIAQFCANDKDEFLRGATLLAASGACDAVDLNLGCPQGIAKRGHYGAFLMEDWALIESLSAPTSSPSHIALCRSSSSLARQPFRAYYSQVPCVRYGRADRPVCADARAGRSADHHLPWAYARSEGSIDRLSGLVRRPCPFVIPV
jgi:hypothetical protein